MTFWSSGKETTIDPLTMFHFVWLPSWSFYKGVSKPIVLGQNWKFFQRFCGVEMNKKMVFHEALEK